MTKINGDLFVCASGANQLAYGECPKCEAQLAAKHVGKSTFLGCTEYPKCDYTQSLSNNDVSIIKAMPESHCPECAASLAVKKGRFGMFIGCTNFPECHFISNTQTPKKSETYQTVPCPSCHLGNIEKKQNRFGKFFFACDNYPDCKYVLNLEPVEVVCQQCNSPVMLADPKKADILTCVVDGCKHQQEV